MVAVLARESDFREKCPNQFCGQVFKGREVVCDWCGRARTHCKHCGVPVLGEGKNLSIQTACIGCGREFE